jgi:hypothetical protein
MTVPDAIEVGAHMLIATNNMQPNTIFFIAVKAVHVSDGFPAHHQELKICTCSIWYLLSLAAATASVVEMELPFHLIHTRTSSH